MKKKYKTAKNLKRLNKVSKIQEKKWINFLTQKMRWIPKSLMKLW